MGEIDVTVVRPPNNLFQNLNTASLAATGIKSTVGFYAHLDEIRVDGSLSASSLVETRRLGFTHSILDDL